MFSTGLNFLPFLSNLKLLSANSFSLEESKICRLGSSIRSLRHFERKRNWRSQLKLLNLLLDWNNYDICYGLKSINEGLDTVNNLSSCHCIFWHVLIYRTCHELTVEIRFLLNKSWKMLLSEPLVVLIIFFRTSFIKILSQQSTNVRFFLSHNWIQRIKLNHFHTMTPFDAPGKQAFWKQCGKRRNCS